MKDRKRRPYIGYVVFGIIYILSLAIFYGCDWSKAEYGVDLEQLLYTITSPLKGADTGVIGMAIRDCLPAVLGGFCVYLLLVILDCWMRVSVLVKIRIKQLSKEICINVISWCRGIVAIACVTVFAMSLLHVENEYDVMAFVEKKQQSTTIYEDYYVSPEEGSIVGDGTEKNLILIYLESMETTYASEQEGGIQDVNLIPELTRLAEEETSFSNGDELGGFYSVNGSTWTAGALFTTLSGIPFAFPMDGNAMSEYEAFAPGVTTLGDILAKKGYQQEFLCGSDVSFGGRQQLFEQHGDYELFDLYTAREKNYIEDDYHVWWGFEDEILYEIAKDEITRLASEGSPFNFTMLTVDTHFPDGYTCNLCLDSYDSVAANVVACADHQIQLFIEWCKEQDFYEDTVIVLLGDHPRMDTALVGDISTKERTVYNCFINSSKTTENVKNRVPTSLDIAPTILSAMGFNIENNRLGLGTDMFSATSTLAEELGLEYLQEELGKYSKFYAEEFY